ncbi:MAG: SDR family NAD(P)-dependent oxidoreductase [Spirochaetales bacterium]|nr:SDR family NAD(P)-dependent oxidoreductase [Spirochaetales bacterium]
MNKQICLITGGNSGIGFEAAKKFARNGYTVIIGCRNKERGLAAEEKIKKSTNNDSVIFIEIDMSLQQSIRKAAKIINEKYDHLDVLIHNAADFDISRKLPVYTIENIESLWATNHIGPVLLSRLLIDLLKKSAQGKILTVASQGLMLHPRLKINYSDPEFRNGRYSVEKAYYQSKLAQVMYTYWLSNYLKDTKLTVNCIRVTNVKIDICRYPDLSKFMKWLYSIKSKFSITSEQMAETYYYLATDRELKNISGKYYDENNKQVKSSSYSYDKKEIDKLMEVTGKYIRKIG